MRSQRSRNSGAGGLWLVRMALRPWRLQDFEAPLPHALGHGGAYRAASWCRQTPFSLTCSPLSRKPLSASKTASRMPKGVSYSSTTRCPTRTVLRSCIDDGRGHAPQVGLCDLRAAAQTRTRRRRRFPGRLRRSATTLPSRSTTARRQRAGGRGGAGRCGPCVLDLHRGRVLADARRGDEGPPLRHVHGIDRGEPGVAVDAGAGIPARVRLARVIHPDGDHVVAGQVQVRRQRRRRS